MKIIRSRFILPKRYAAINLAGVIFVRPETNVSDVILNHERIHSAQIFEMGILPFYVFYLAEWLVRLPMRGRAYRNISFEREAYDRQNDLDYLSHRRHYAWWAYLKKKHIR